ncbi:FtsX-like permease family protein [Frankia sp. CNm7]|uniref:FtsX-like permease family protein n=2 Tax=Frankia nepalensis TaxID=1836974 RepID=A0A937UN93_9ACTN|nr:FtsX-like permease family protein [Frankia nepalensis]MBL7508576.1 FtsX-like permease family protein [Frankia nepalensis]MBL7517796.1 FtsX-like permease family protein [Frankia nepalensis]MBL7627707.1 FtsX-like permease family protein [Frankia nepalensis]
MTGMTGLALRSLRHRLTASVATFLAVLFGTVLIGAFATLAETAFAIDGVTAEQEADQETLTIMGIVVGSWGTVIVLFAVASTVGITAARRAGEIGLLRTIGATPRQARRLICREALAVAVCGALIGAVLAAGVGWLLLDLLRGELVASSVEFRGGPASVGAAAALVTLTSAVAAAIAARRATRGPASLTLRESEAETGRMRWYRVAVALLLIGYGVGLGAVTIFVMADSDDPYAAMQTSGSSSILVGVGFAMLAPALLRWVSAPAARLLARVGGRGAGYLAAYNTSRRAHRLASVLAPVIVLTSGAIGTLMLVSIDSRTLAGTGDYEETVNLLNNVVVGMVSLFAAIMVVNAFAAGTADRRAELRRLWLLGGTPAQIRRSLAVEAGIVAAVGLVVGTLGSLATIVPFSIARDEGVVPDAQLWIPAVIAVAVVLLVLTAARVAARATIRVAVQEVR